VAKSFYLIALCALLAPSVSLGAGDSQRTGPWTLQECLSTAMRNNIDVTSSANSLTIARSRLTSANSSYLPQVSVQNTAFTWGDGGVLTKSSTGTAISVDQNVYDGGLRETKAQGARYGVTQSSSALTRTYQSVTFSVTKAFYEALRARHLAGVAEANVKYNEGLRDQVQGLADAGQSAKVDVLPVEAQLANSRVSLLSSQNTVRTSALQLQSAMGIASQPGFEVAEIADPPKAEVGTLDGYVDSALKSRPDITQSQAATGAARASVKSARISLYPRPVISASYQRQISGGFTTSGTQMVGGIAFDVFDGGANRAAYRQAEAERDNSQAQEAELVRNVRSETEEAYLNLTNSRERLAASAVSLEASKLNFDAQKERYGQGIGTTLDLLNAEVQLVTAQSTEVEARYDCYIAIAQLEYAVGGTGGQDER